MKTATIRKTPKGWRLSIAVEPEAGSPYLSARHNIGAIFPTADDAENTLRTMGAVRTLSRDSRSRVFTLRTK